MSNTSATLLRSLPINQKRFIITSLCNKYRFFIKLYTTSNTETVKICHSQFSSDLRSVIIEKHTKKFKESLTKVNYSYSSHVCNV